MSKYTDRTDVDLIVSLYEQGCIRNPKTDKTLIHYFSMYHHRTMTKSVFISMIDILDVLETLDESYFKYIGQTYEEVKLNLDNDHLSCYIQSINDWNGYFINDY